MHFALIVFMMTDWVQAAMAFLHPSLAKFSCQDIEAENGIQKQHAGTVSVLQGRSGILSLAKDM